MSTCGKNFNRKQNTSYLNFKSSIICKMTRCHQHSACLERSKYKSISGLFTAFFELLFLLIGYQDGVLELKSPTHSWALSSILVTVLGSFLPKYFGQWNTIVPTSEGKEQKEKGSKTQTHLVCHFVFKEISENIIRLMVNLKRLDDLWGVFIYAILSHN